MGSRDKAQGQELEGLPEDVRDGSACKGAEVQAWLTWTWIQDYIQ